MYSFSRATWKCVSKKTKLTAIFDPAISLLEFLTKKIIKCMVCYLVTKSCPTFCNPIDCSMPGFLILYYILEFAHIHVHWVGDAIQPSHPVAPLLLPSNLSQHQGLFKWVSSSHQVAKVLEFQLQHQSFQWTPRMICFRMDWLDLLEIQRTFRSLLQHHISKASILWHSAFFIVQLSHPCMTTGKTIALI